tara:strand:+ start:227 stop:448 length:222 start_codon:yes stop_codon:yes gene_type:complete
MAKKKTTKRWGGSRPGSGRPKGARPWFTRSVTFREETLDAVDQASDAEGVSRSAWINQAIAKELKRIARRKGG